MADFADDAQAMEELALSHAIAQARKTGERQLTPCGTCYNCGEPLYEDEPIRGDGLAVESGDIEAVANEGPGEGANDSETPRPTKLFCDEFCSEDWHKRAKLMARR